LETKFSKITHAGEFVGLASTFGNVDLQADIVLPGAFSRSLAEHRSAGTTPAMLWSHRTDEPIGTWSDLKESSAGLEVRGKLTLDVQRAADAHALMKDGALSLSIGYMVAESEYDGEGNRLLKAVDLFEISAVSIPANPQARISDVKSISSKRQLETKLHQVGFSVREARKLARGGWETFRDDESDEIKQVAQLIRASTQR